MSPDPDKSRQSPRLFALLRNRRLRVHILTGFVPLLVVTVAVILWYTYHHNANAIVDLSTDLINQGMETITEKTTHYLHPVADVVRMSAHLAEQGVLSLADNERLESYAVEVLKTHAHVAMFNIADEQGNFLMPKKLADGTIATKLINRNATPPSVTWKYRDATGRVTQVETSLDVKYDPRTRPWYRGAKQSRTAYWTDMYVLFTDQKPGITAGYPIVGKDGHVLGVLGLDIELGQMSDFLGRLKIGKTGTAFIFNSRDEVVAYPDVSRLIRKEGSRLRPATIEELNVRRIAEAVRHFRRTGDERFEFQCNGKRHIGAFADLAGAVGRQWTIGIVVPEDDFLGALRETNRVALLMGIVILLVGVLFATLLARTISQPIVRLTRETVRIRQFDLEGEPGIRSSIREIQSMTDALAAMKTGLKAFRKYVPAALVRQLIETGDEARIGGQTRHLTVFFSDIAGFTPIAESMTPEDLMRHLSEYLDEMTRIVMGEKGTVDKYIGDSIMAFWGAPVWDDHHAVHACCAALGCQQRLRELNAQWTSHGKSPLSTRIGIHTGPVVVGNMGSSDRMNYSVLGDSVNLASRLEGVNKLYRTQIVVSDATRERAPDRFVFRPLDRVTVKGKEQGIRIHELMAEKGQHGCAESEQLQAEFLEAMQAYDNRDWDAALRAFEGVVQRFPSDGPSKVFIMRCMAFQAHPPSDDWDGVVHLDAK